MTIPMYGAQYPQQQQYYYPGMVAPQQQQFWPTQPAPAADSGSDVNAILGSIIEPLMGLVFSMLSGTSGSDQTTQDPLPQDPGTTDPGASDSTLGPESQAADYLDVLSQNDSELKDLERKFGNRDGQLTAKEISKILRQVERGDTKGIEVSTDLQAALTWLDQDSTGQTVFANLANAFDEDGRAAVDVKKGFDESAWDNVDGDIEEDVTPVDGEEVVQYLVDNKPFANKVAGSDGKITQAEVDTALKSNDYSLEEKAQLRFLRENFVDITDAMYLSDNQPISLNDLATKLDNKTEVDGNNVVDELQNIESNK